MGEAGQESVDLGIEGLGPGALIGAGGGGRIYRARQLELDRDVAVKKVHLAGDEATLRHFREERQRMANIPFHAGVAPVFSAGLSATGEPYFIMPFYSDGSLADRVRNQGRLRAEEAVRMIAAVARAVHHVHAYDVLHCDIKPDNVMLDGDRPVVVDFGITRLLNGPQNVTSAIRLTPSYAPPEAWTQGLQVDRRFDVYSLGATLCALIAGEPPFDSREGMMAIAARVASEPPPNLRHLAPDPICRAMERAMAKQPDQRQDSALALADELEAALALHDEQTRRAPPPPPPDSPRPAASRRWQVMAGIAAGAVLLPVLAFGAAKALPGDTTTTTATISTTPTTPTTPSTTPTTPSTSTTRTRPTGPVELRELVAGDCIRFPVGDSDTVTRIDCSSRAPFEVTGTKEFTGAGGAYPGREALIRYARTQCPTIFTSYVGTSASSTELYSGFRVPTATQWTNGRLYSVICLASYADPNRLISTSVRGRGGAPDVKLGLGDVVPILKVGRGECFVDASPGATPSKVGLFSQLVTLVGCTTSHRGEVVGQGVFTQAIGAPYDKESLKASAQSDCEQQFTSYSGSTDQQGTNGVVPDEDEWNRSNRDYVCIRRFGTPATKSVRKP